MLYGLVGEHLPHSYSKIIHESLEEYDFSIIELPPEEFGDFIANRQYNGLTITIPYKQKVIPYCDDLSVLAKTIGAVNTLYFQEGRLIGTNTDYHGFLYTAENIPFKGKKVAILGNGGTSLTARKAAEDQGASEILIASRRGEAGCVSYDELPSDTEIIVNTTPVGMYPNNGQRILDLERFPKCCGVIDVIYNPMLTDLLIQAKDRGIPHAGGLPMLVAQATAAAQFFMNKSFDHENTRIIAMLERQIENIVLTGMPGCGKTTLGTRLAKTLNRTFVDLDKEIEKKEGKTIPEIFAEKGEDYFRDLETEMAQTFGKEKSLVIATGGGIVLRKENMDALMQNGRVVFLERSLETLATKGRPLSKDADTIKVMYEHRLPLYNKYSDLVFQVGSNIEKDEKQLLALIR